MRVYSLNVYPSSKTIKVGTWYYDAYAVVIADSGCYRDVEWYSDNTSVATVNPSSGYIRGISPGTARIYARSKFDSSKKDYITITVTQGVICVESVSLNKSAITLEKDERYTLKATVCPENATNKSILWATSKASVATVENGVVTAKSKGTATIYAEARDGSGELARCVVTVTEDVLVTSINLNHSRYTLNAYGNVTLRATVCPCEATNKCVRWTSSNTAVATVNPDTGIVMAQGAGTAKIRASALDGSGVYAECDITVNPPVAVESVMVCPETVTLEVGETKYLTKIIYPENAFDKRVIWQSNNEKVASVDYYTGEIQANSLGTAIITAISVDGKCCDSVRVTVNKKINSVSTEKTIFGGVVTEAGVFPQAYNVTLIISYAVSAKENDCVKLDYVSVFAKYDKNNITDGVDYPDLSIGITTLNGNQINLVNDNGDHIYSPNWVLVDKIAQINEWVEICSTITTKAIVMLDSTLVAYRDVDLSTTLMI